MSERNTEGFLLFLCKMAQDWLPQHFFYSAAINPHVESESMLSNL